MRKAIVLIAAGLAAATLSAQSAPGTVQASGSATLSVNPDMVRLDISVITQGTTAQQAAQQNATQTTAVINALKQVLGGSGSVQTVSYSVNPRYNNSPGQNDVIVGYTVTNSVRVTSNDLTLPGSLIDTANQAGASNVGGLAFGLQNSDPYIQQALTAAAKQALAHAAAIAAGLGGKTGAVISAQESSSYSPIVTPGIAAGVQTPVLTGTVSVSATVTVTVQLM
jgi:uncharacterized protein